ncbi:MAG: hypothetical protein J7619_27720 [Dyadobacter sp.]|uniref:M57 family metalloprotease n=1 Tax=Dyadobacter sp. TaxID=1914288 RepID=UPI001B27F144|nr:M57 family metalloprotease [Dyadobacter sp.]MBO9616509.1 hypothetical protein [Dyadobacter sp.]
MKQLVLSVIALAGLFSCQENEISTIKNEEVQVEKPNQAQTSQKVYSYIKSLGFKDSEIKDIGNDFLVDGDMLFDKSVVPDTLNNRNGRVQQYGVSNYIGYNEQPFVTVRIDPSMSAYTNDITAAIANWNNVPGCRVNLTLVTGSDADIAIYNSDLGSNTCGNAYTPINGQAGNRININVNVVASFSTLQRRRTITHELGHAIGFAHTNWSSIGETNEGNWQGSLQHIFGTPTGTDANSLMNGGECNFGATALSSNDILTAQFLYPENPPVAGSVPIYRYFSRNGSKDHLYTANINEKGNGSNNDYIYEGIAFYAFSTQVAGTVPVYRYFHGGASLGDHFYTLNQSDVSGNPAYTYEGIAFYAYNQAINNAVPIHRYWNSSIDDHFYSKNNNEVATLPSGYIYEFAVFYAY